MQLPQRLKAIVLAAAGTLLVAAGTVVAIKKAAKDQEFTLSTGAGPSSPAPLPSAPPAAPPAPARRVTATDVAARPWPARAKASGTWKAHLEGSGPNLRLWAPTLV